MTFHTSGKLNGAVALAFYSMWAVVLSGFVGRYLYAKIPRTRKGNEMDLKGIEVELAELVRMLQNNESADEVKEQSKAYRSLSLYCTGVQKDEPQCVVDSMGND